MAKKLKSAKGQPPVDLDLFDLDTFDDPFSDDGAIDKAKGPIRRFLGGFTRGFRQGALSTRTLDVAVRGALPDGYGQTLDALMKTYGGVSDIASELRRTNARDLAALAKKTEALLPKLKGKTSAKLYEGVERRLKDLREGLEFDASAGKTEEQYRQETDEALMAAALGQQAGLQTEIAKAQETAEQERFNIQRTERAIRDRLAGIRHDSLSRQLGFVGEQLARQVAYQDQINYQYQRKSLELQYRQFFALRDLKAIAQATQKIHIRAYDALIHNSSIPDHIKATNADWHRFDTTQAGPSRFRTTLKEGLPEFMANFFPRIKDNIQNQVQSMLSGLGMALSMGGMVDGDPAGLAGEGVGGGIGGMLGRAIASRVAIRGRAALDKLDKRTGGRSHQLSYFLQNAPSIIRDYTTDVNQSGFLGGALQDLVRAVVPTYFRDDSLGDGTYQTIDRQASFNHLTQRSIVEIIPGYLSRILHEARILRTGDPSTPREVYDITSGKFTGYAEAKARMLGRLIPESQRRNLEDMLNETVANYDPEGKLSAEAQEALRERLLRDASKGNRFDPTRYAEGGYAPSTSEETLAELNRFFKEQFQFREDGRLDVNHANMRRLNEMSNRFLVLQQSLPDIRRELSRVMGTGSQELLRDLGLVGNIYGEDRIDYDKVWSYYRGGEATQGISDGEAPRDNPAKGAFRQFMEDPEAQDRFFTEQVKKGIHRGRRAFKRGKDQVAHKASDLYRDLHGEELVLRAKEMAEGVYTDVNTQRVIQTVEDITGDVRDQLGRVVVKGEELAEGLYDETGRKVLFRNLAERFRRGALTAGRYGRQLGGVIAERLRSAITSKDVYVKGRERPALLARDLKAGRYRDMGTGKIIRAVGDITGEVRDLDDNVVLTAEEYAEGLLDADGAKLSPTQGEGFWNKYLQATSSPMRFIAGKVRKGLVGAAKYLWKKLTLKKDAYIAGEETPRLQVALLRAGKYIDATTGQVITSFDQIKGAVMDTDGNILVSAEEIPHLVNSDGSKHQVAKRPSLLRRMARGYWNMSKAYYKWLGPTALKLGGKLGRGAGKVLGGIGRGLGRLFTSDVSKIKPEAIETPTDGFLYRIMSLLDERLPGKQRRRGSWQDQLEEQAKTDKGEETKEKDRWSGKGPLAGMLGGLKKLFGFGRGDEDGEEEGDTTIITGDLGGGEGDGKKKKNKRNRKPKGRLGRALQGAKKWGGRLLFSPTAAVGRLGLMGLAGAGKGLLAAGTALAGVLSAPVVLGALAVGAAGYVGYKYYQKRQRASGAFREFRLTQYGVSPNGWSEAGKVLDLEEIMGRAVSFGEGTATIDMGRVDIKAVLELMGVDGDDPQHVANFVTWMDLRFQKVFLNYLGALKALAPDVALIDLDDKLPPAQGMAFLERVKFPYSGETPYNVTASPFSGTDELSITIEDIKQREAAVVAKYKDAAAAAKEGEVKTPVPTKAAAGALATGVPSPLRPADPRKVVELPVLDVALAGSKEEVLSIVSNTNPIELGQRPLTGLETIRLKAYGLHKLNPSTVQAVIGLEAYVLKLIVLDGQKQAVFNGDVEDVLLQYAASFGVSDRGSEHYAELRNWLRLRFMPVVVNYASAVMRVLPNAPLTHSQARLERMMDPIAQVSVAKALLGTKVDYQGTMVSVWSIPFGPSGPLERLEDLERNARGQLELMEAVADNFELKTAVDAVKQTGPGRGSTAPGQTRPAPSTTPGATPSSRGSVPGVLPTPRRPTPLQRSGGNIALGNVYSGIQKGTGGLWESIPFPTSKTLQGSLVTLEAVAAMTGVDVGILVTIASIESSFDWTARNKQSSAAGWYQFIDTTWREVVSKYGSKYDIPTSDPSGALRLDPRANALMGAEFLKANYKRLEQGLGRKPTDTDLYIAHFFGCGGALKFLKLDINQIAAVAFRAAAESNPTIFYTAGGQPRTVGEVYRFFDDKVSQHRYGLTSGSGLSVEAPANDQDGLLASNAAVNDPAYQSEAGTMPDDAPKISAKSLFNLQSAGDLASAASRPIHPATPTVVTTPTSSGQAPVADTPATPEPVVVQQTLARRQAAAADKRQQQQILDGMTASRELLSISEKQLVVQETMRDYLRVIAENLGVNLTGDARNPTSASTQRTHRPGNTAPPVAMKHRR